MKVWLVNQYAVPPSMAGPPRHYQLARELTRLGHEVVLIASSFDHHGAHTDSILQPGERWRTGRRDGVDFLWLRVPAYQGNSRARVWSMLRFADRVRTGVGTRDLPRPDVVIGSSPHLFGAWGAQRLSRRLGVPFVLEVRDVWPQSLVDLGGYARGHPVVRALTAVEHHLYRRASAVISLLPDAVDHIVAGSARREHVHYVPNGIDLRAAPAPAEVPAHDGFIVMYAGSHGIANGLDTVLDAAKLLEDELGGGAPRFELLGDGVEKGRLVQRARDEGIATVRFLEAVPKAQVFGELARADAFVVSSLPTPLYRHGVSFNKFFDYMAMARPIVAGLEASSDPVLAAGAGLTVPPKDPRAMADAILNVMAMTPEERRSMGLRGRAYVERHHDMADLARRVEEVLSDVIGDGSVLRRSVG